MDQSQHAGPHSHNDDQRFEDEDGVGVYYCDSLAHTNTVRLDRPLVDTAEFDWPDFGYLDIDSKVEIAAVVTPPLDCFDELPCAGVHALAAVGELDDYHGRD